MSFSIDPSDPDESGDKGMNNQKTVNLADPTDHRDAVTKKYVDEKTETIDLFPFLSNMPPEISSLSHSSGKKQHAGITQTRNQTVKYYITVSLLSINQD